MTERRPRCAEVVPVRVDGRDVCANCGRLIVRNRSTTAGPKPAGRHLPEHAQPDPAH